MKINTHTGGHILVRINRALFLNASGGLDTSPRRVIPRPMSRETYIVAARAIAPMMPIG